MDEIETLLVTGEQPGPGLWKVSRGDHVLWILGGSGPLSKDMRWRSAAIEARVADSQQVLYTGRVQVAPDIGVFRALTLLPALLKAGKNPDGATLKDVLPAPTYAKWRALAGKYDLDHDVERWRPEFALEQLRDRAVKRSGLSFETSAGATVNRAAKKHHVPITRPPTVEREVHVEDVRGTLKRFAKRDVSDVACFERDLDQLEKRLDRAKAFANAWASGDIDVLREWHARARDEASRDRPCFELMMAAVADEPGIKATMDAVKAQADIAARANDWNWLQAARKALMENRSTFAVLPMNELFDPDGLVAALRAEGYAVEEP